MFAIDLQNLSLAPNCITRIGSPKGLTLVEPARDEVAQQVRPKLSFCLLLVAIAGDPTVALRGFSKLA